MHQTPLKGVSRSAWSALLGNFFEHYDTALFGFLSPFFAPIFFPKENPITALILTYAMIPLSMLARPIGSLVFGYIGDRYGRREALFLSLGGMGLVSLGIAFCPTYVTVGIVAPILFCFWRFAQHFLAAGEIMGGGILLLENTSEHRRDLASSIYNASTVGGMLLASAGVSLLAHHWRLLYIFGTITALFGLLLRMRMPQEKTVRTPFSLSIWKHKGILSLLILISGFAYVTFTMALVLMNGFIPLITPFTKTQMSSINTGLLIFDILLLPLFGWLSSKVSREKVMIGATLAVVLFAFPLFSLLPHMGLWGIILIRTVFVVIGVAFFASFHAWASGLVPSENRYAIISLGYALGTQILGGPTAALSLWMYKKTGLIWSIGWYWVMVAIMSTVALFVLQRRRRYAIQ